MDTRHTQTTARARARATNTTKHRQPPRPATHLLNNRPRLRNRHLPLFSLFAPPNAPRAPLGQLEDLVRDKARIGPIKSETRTDPARALGVAPCASRYVDLNGTIIERPFFQQGPKVLSLVLICVLAHQHVEDTLFDRGSYFLCHLLLEPFSCHRNRHVDQVANDLVNVLPVETNFGELGRLYLDEWRLGQLGDAASNLRLAATRGADHEDVFGDYLVTQFVAELVPAPTVAEGYCYCALGVILSHDKLIQLVYHLARLEGGQERRARGCGVYFLCKRRSCRRRLQCARGEVEGSVREPKSGAEEWKKWDTLPTSGLPATGSPAAIDSLRNSDPTKPLRDHLSLPN